MSVRKFYGYQGDAKWYDKLTKRYFTVKELKRMTRVKDKRIRWKKTWPYFESRAMVYVETKWTE